MFGGFGIGIIFKLISFIIIFCTKFFKFGKFGFGGFPSPFGF
ncbi:hypothetical protein [Risungbinella massiliensis]|nr:hypothetical protein [Risungbinella massiliensis]